MTSPIFGKIYDDYLAQLREINLAERAERLGLTMQDGEVLIHFHNGSYLVSYEGIRDLKGERPRHSVCVMLFRYLINCPDYEPTRKSWVTYKDFRDAAPFVGAFKVNVEMAVAKGFSGRLAELEKAAEQLKGRRPEEAYPYDFAMIFDGLSRIPVMILFNDADEEFPASSTFLFEQRAEEYLDMECLIMAAWGLADLLCQRAGTERLPLDAPDIS